MYGLNTGNVPMSAGMAALNFNYGMNGPSGLVATAEGLGFDWTQFDTILSKGLDAAKPLIAAGANKISGGSVLPYDPNRLGAYPASGYPAGTVGMSGSVVADTNLSTSTLVMMGLGALVLVVVLSRR